MNLSGLLGNAANAVTVCGAVIVVVLFCWRVLRRLAQIVALLNVVHDLEARIKRIEQFLGLLPAGHRRSDTP